MAAISESEASKGVWTLDIVKVDEVVVKITLVAKSNPNFNANANPNPNPNPNICMFSMNSLLPSNKSSNKSRSSMVDVHFGFRH